MKKQKASTCGNTPRVSGEKSPADICAFFEGTVAAALEKRPSGAVFLAAVSGGADSSAMLAAVSAVKKSGKIGNFQLICVTVNHGIRPREENEGDAAFTAGFCKELGVECKTVTFPQGKIAAHAKKRGLSLEAAARNFRRKALLREAARHVQAGSRAVILTGHTKNDSLENTLMRVLRGAGAAGLSAMPQKKGAFLRPILSLTRGQVLLYLAAKKIPWREDATNADAVFLRNKVRLALIPLLNEAFPFWQGGVSAMAVTQSLAASFIRDEAARRVKWERQAAYSFGTEAENFFSQPPVIREEAVFLCVNVLAKSSKNAPSFSPKRSVIRDFCSGGGTRPNSLELGRVAKASIVLKYENGRVTLFAKKRAPFESGFALLIKTPGLYTAINGVSVEVAPYQAAPRGAGKPEAGLFYASLPFVLRSGGGDFIVSGGRKVKFSVAKWIMVAEDGLGAAAFVCADGKTLARDEPDLERTGLFPVLVKGKSLRPSEM